MLRCWWDDLRLHLLYMWALLKLLEREAVGVIYAEHLPPIVMRCGDKKTRAQEERKCWRQNSDFPLMVNAPQRVLTRLEVSVRLLRYRLTALSYFFFSKL